MIKINEKLAILPVRHGTKNAIDEVKTLVSNMQKVPFKVLIGLELNKSDAYYILKQNMVKSEFYEVLDKVESQDYFFTDMSNTELINGVYP